MTALPLRSGFLKLDHKRFSRRVAQIRFRRAHIFRGLTKSKQFGVVHLVETCSQLFEVEFAGRD